MTEQEWLTGDDAGEMARFIMGFQGMQRRRAGRRKLRLFGCASCRQLWEFMTDPRSRKAVEVAEQLADGLTKPAEVQEALTQAEEARRATATVDYKLTKAQKKQLGANYLRGDLHRAADAASTVLDSRAGYFAWAGLCYGFGPTCPEYPIYHARRIWQAEVLRCLFGNPFHPVAFDPSWLTSNVTAIAQAIYDDHRFEEMPILADALEEAGCTSEEILAHCRGDNVHVRGCWVVDQILGKS